MSDAVPCYVLAGGASSRFGSDKARALLRGRPLIVNAGVDLGDGVFAVADRAGRYDDLGLTTLADESPGRGPLGGVVTALAHAAAAGRARALVVGCDQPDAGDVAAALLAGTGEAVVYAHDGQPSPLPGVYATSLLAEAREMLAGDGRAPGPRRLVERCVTRGTATLLHADAALVADVNRPGDLDALKS